MSGLWGLATVRSRPRLFSLTYRPSAPPSGHGQGVSRFPLPLHYYEREATGRVRCALLFHNVATRCAVGT